MGEIATADAAIRINRSSRCHLVACGLSYSVLRKQF